MTWDLPAGVDWTGLIGGATGYFLVISRVFGLCLTAPGLALPGLEWRARVGLSVVLGAVISPIMGSQVISPPGSHGIIWAGMAEIVTGSLLGLSAGLIVAGARLAGELVSAQAGLSTSTLFDPDSGEELTVMGRLYGGIALAAFLVLDGPMALVQSLAESYTVIPAGSLMVSRDSIMLTFGQVGRAMELALRAAAPPAIALVMAGIVLGWLSRTAPALPFLALSLPIRAGLGIMLILLGLAALAATLSTAWNEVLPIR